MAVAPKPKPLPGRWTFTVDEFQQMGKLGVFTEDDRVELIDGELIRLDLVTPPHAGHVIRLIRLVSACLRDSAILGIHDPLPIQPRDELLPDVMVLKPRADDYTTSHPVAADVLLLIEVADSSVGYDTVTKAAIYAQAGIADYWVVDLVDSTLIVMREPVDGSYRSVQTLTREDSLIPLAFPDVTISVGEILA